MLRYLVTLVVLLAVLEASAVQDPDAVTMALQGALDQQLDVVEGPKGRGIAPQAVERPRQRRVRPLSMIPRPRPFRYKPKAGAAPPSVPALAVPDDVDACREFPCTTNQQSAVLCTDKPGSMNSSKGRTCTCVEPGYSYSNDTVGCATGADASSEEAHLTADVCVEYPCAAGEVAALCKAVPGIFLSSPKARTCQCPSGYVYVDDTAGCVDVFQCLKTGLSRKCVHPCTKAPELKRGAFQRQCTSVGVGRDTVCYGRCHAGTTPSQPAPAATCTATGWVVTGSCEANDNSHRAKVHIRAPQNQSLTEGPDGIINAAEEPGMQDRRRAHRQHDVVTHRHRLDRPERPSRRHNTAELQQPHEEAHDIGAEVDALLSAGSLAANWTSTESTVDSPPVESAPVPQEDQLQQPALDQAAQQEQQVKVDGELKVEKEEKQEKLNDALPEEPRPEQELKSQPEAQGRNKEKSGTTEDVEEDNSNTTLEEELKATEEADMKVHRHEMKTGQKGEGKHEKLEGTKLDDAKHKKSRDERKHKANAKGDAVERESDQHLEQELKQSQKLEHKQKQGAEQEPEQKPEQKKTPSDVLESLITDDDVVIEVVDAPSGADDEGEEFEYEYIIEEIEVEEDDESEAQVEADNTKALPSADAPLGADNDANGELDKKPSKSDEVDASTNKQKNQPHAPKQQGSGDEHVADRARHSPVRRPSRGKVLRRRYQGQGYEQDGERVLLRRRNTQAKWQQHTSAAKEPASKDQQQSSIPGNSRDQQLSQRPGTNRADALKKGSTPDHDYEDAEQTIKARTDSYQATKSQQPPQAKAKNKDAAKNPTVQHPQDNNAAESPAQKPDQKGVTSAPLKTDKHAGSKAALPHKPQQGAAEGAQGKGAEDSKKNSASAKGSESTGGKAVSAPQRQATVQSKSGPHDQSKPVRSTDAASSKAKSKDGQQGGETSKPTNPRAPAARSSPSELQQQQQQLRKAVHDEIYQLLERVRQQQEEEHEHAVVTQQQLKQQLKQQLVEELKLFAGKQAFSSGSPYQGPEQLWEEALKQAAHTKKSATPSSKNKHSKREKAPEEQLSLMSESPETGSDDITMEDDADAEERHAHAKTYSSQARTGSHRSSRWQQQHQQVTTSDPDSDGTTEDDRQDQEDQLEQQELQLRPAGIDMLKRLLKFGLLKDAQAAAAVAQIASSSTPPLAADSKEVSVAAFNLSTTADASPADGAVSAPTVEPAPTSPTPATAEATAAAATASEAPAAGWTVVLQEDADSTRMQLQEHPMAANIMAAGLTAAAKLPPITPPKVPVQGLAPEQRTTRRTLLAANFGGFGGLFAPTPSSASSSRMSYGSASGLPQMDDLEELLGGLDASAAAPPKAQSSSKSLDPSSAYGQPGFNTKSLQYKDEQGSDIDDLEAELQSSEVRRHVRRQRDLSSDAAYRGDDAEPQRPTTRAQDLKHTVLSKQPHDDLQLGTGSRVGQGSHHHHHKQLRHQQGDELDLQPHSHHSSMEDSPSSSHRLQKTWQQQPEAAASDLQRHAHDILDTVSQLQPGGQGDWGPSHGSDKTGGWAAQEEDHQAPSRIVPHNGRSSAGVPGPSNAGPALLFVTNTAREKAGSITVCQLIDGQLGACSITMIPMFKVNGKNSYPQPTGIAVQRETSGRTKLWITDGARNPAVICTLVGLDVSGCEEHRFKGYGDGEFEGRQIAVSGNIAFVLAWDKACVVQCLDAKSLSQCSCVLGHEYHGLFPVGLTVSGNKLYVAHNQGTMSGVMTCDFGPSGVNECIRNPDLPVNVDGGMVVYDGRLYMSYTDFFSEDMSERAGIIVCEDADQIRPNNCRYSTGKLGVRGGILGLAVHEGSMYIPLHVKSQELSICREVTDTDVAGCSSVHTTDVDQRVAFRSPCAIAIMPVPADQMPQPTVQVDESENKIDLLKNY